MMFRVVDLHGPSIDVRLERIVSIGQCRKFVGHQYRSLVLVRSKAT